MHFCLYASDCWLSPMSALNSFRTYGVSCNKLNWISWIGFISVNWILLIEVWRFVGIYCTHKLRVLNTLLKNLTPKHPNFNLAISFVRRNVYVLGYMLEQFRNRIINNSWFIEGSFISIKIRAISMFHIVWM